MAEFYVKYDTVAGKFKTGPTPGAPVDESFDVTDANGQTTFTLATTIDSGTKIDVYENGILKREGASRAWQRDTNNNQVIFNTAVSQDSWVLVRIY